MSKDKTKQAGSPKAPSSVTEQDKIKARKWFEHGKAVADSHNYDYAIECFINGLALWPEAVEEGHKPLRAVAFARLGAGKKKPGILEALKYPTSSRDPLQSALNAERLLAKDPNNLTYMAALLKNAFKAGCEQTCLWLGAIFLEEAATASKPQPDKLTTICDVFEQLGDQANQRGDVQVAVQAFEYAAQALEALVRLKPNDGPIQDRLRNVSGKLTIAKGHFETAGDFRDSLRDADKQRELHDQDRMVQDEQRLNELIDAARKEASANPNETGKVFGLVDLLLRRGRREDEDEAIRILIDGFKRTKVYQFKMRADEIRIRQLRRQAREIVAKADKQAAREHLKKQLEFEIAVFKERIEHYPTESRFKYELGKRLFQDRRFDEAVPVLQQARTDPKYKIACQCLIAQCFFHKGYYDQAIELLKDAIEEYELAGDETSKDLHYWLARCYEAAGQNDLAAKTHGQIIQWDYNYRDVRQRLEKLQQRPEAPPADSPPPEPTEAS